MKRLEYMGSGFLPYRLNTRYSGVSFMVVSPTSVVALGRYTKGLESTDFTCLGKVCNRTE